MKKTYIFILPIIRFDNLYRVLLFLAMFLFKAVPTEAGYEKPISNNNAPVFNPSNYSFTVSEEIALAGSAGKVTATDTDGDALTYSIMAGNTNSCFDINAISGSITVAKRLNHHTQDSYSITVRVTDAGGLSDDATAVINIQAGTPISSFTNINWGTAASQPYGTHEVHGEVVNGKLYIFGGYDVEKRPAYTPTKRAFVYNPVTNVWAAIADLPHTPNGINFGGITHEGLATDGTDIYFAGGYTSNSNGTGQLFGTKQVWKYNVATNSYKALPGLPLELATGQLRYLKGKLHYMGGANKSRRDTTVHYALDLDNLSAGWKVLAPLLNGTNHAGSEVFEGKIYYIAGSHGQDDAAVAQKTVQVYDEKTNNWTLAANLPTARDHISSGVTVVGTRILVLGGETSHNVKSNLVSAYTPSTNTWTNLTSLPVTKAAGIAGVLNGILYYTGGNFSAINYKGTPAASASLQVVSFTLVNADTEQPIQTLKSGDTLNLFTLPTQNLNIRANTNPSVIGSVVFNLSGAQSKNVTESKVPYALFGDDNNGNYYAWTPAIGNYTLKATPYSASGGTGTVGTVLTVAFTVINQATQSTTLSPLADASVRNGSFSAINYGSDPSLAVKSSPGTGYTRVSYLRFSLNSVSNVSSAKLRIYGKNTESTLAVNIYVYAVDNDSWTENTITWNSAPVASPTELSSIAVNDQAKYYELDVTSFVKTQFAGDKLVTFLLKDPATINNLVAFNSKENAANKPRLLIESTGTAIAWNTLVLPASGTSFINTKVYPNPIHKNFNVEFPKGYKRNFTLQIVDPMGRTYNLDNIKLGEASTIEIDISKLSLRKGVYFLRIYSDTRQTEIVKLMIY